MEKKELENRIKQLEQELHDIKSLQEQINKELVFENEEKEKRAAELVIARKELVFQNTEKEKRATELIIANKELAFQNEQKEKRAAELVIANEELAFENEEKEKRAAELVVANKELAFQNEEKKKRAAELVIARKELVFQNTEKEKRAAELIIANKELAFQNAQKEKREAELMIANKELIFQNTEKEKRAEELVIANKELVFQNTEKEKRAEELVIARDNEQQSQITIASKQQFLANMSHEIRTPMTAIIGFSKVVLKTDLSEKQRQYISAIKTSSDALLVLINDILDLAKVDSGKMTFEQAAFEMETDISAMLQLFDLKVQEKNLKLIKEYDTKIPKILIGDSVRLNQIILNLVSNAVKFTSKGKITLSVRLVETFEQKVTIEFVVTDTGIGLAENMISTIFESFQQATSSTARQYGGTGLGLAIVKQLVERQGGTINVKSKINEGSTFSFVLSFQKSNGKIKSESLIPKINPGIKKIKILAVEDIALNQMLLKIILDDFGFQRDFAENGKEAIEKLQANSYDIILMDIQMPVMDGLEATEYIRNKMNSKIPIIALTADVTMEDLEKCKAIGMNDHVSKPIDEKILYNKIVALVLKNNGHHRHDK